MIEIDPILLSQPTLDNLIREFLIRQGTDYGCNEHTLALKTEQMRRKIDQGLAVIVYSATDNFCDIVSSEQFHRMLKKEHKILD